MVHFRYKWRKSRGGIPSIYLPRQARDKRRETALKKRCVFLVGKEHFTDRRVVRPAGTGTGTQATHARARAHTHADGQKQTANSKQTHAHHFDAFCALRFAFCVLRFMQALREHTTHTEPPPPMLPAAAAAADSSSDMAAPVQLPSGWSEHVSGSTGETYATQHNTATQNRHNIFP